jgi:ribosomal protein L22
MTYTCVPKGNFAKASSKNTKISTKDCIKLCRFIRGKKLSTAKRLLLGMANETIDMSGKHYTTAAREMLTLLESCEKNAVFMGFNVGNMFVHASAHMGNNIRRRRRKASYGSKMKATNLEIMVIERAKAVSKPVAKK